MRTVVPLRLRYGAYGARSIICSRSIASPCRCVWPAFMVLKRVSLWAMQLSGIKASNVIGIVSRCNNVFVNGFTPFRALVALVLLIPISAQAAKKPTSEKINGDSWAIKYVHPVREGGLDGSTECPEATIYIDKTLTTFEQAETLVHETLHGLTCTCIHAQWCEVVNQKYDNPIDPHTGDDHPGIYFAAPKLQLWMIDNKEVIEWIREQSQPPPIDFPAFVKPRPWN